MKHWQRVTNVVFLFFLFLIKTGIEFRQNHVPLQYLFTRTVLLAPTILCIAFYWLGEWYIWLRSEEKKRNLDVLC